jgi:hypothetical protein
VIFSSDITFLLSEFPASEEKCFQYIFFLFASMAFSLSVLCMQADRFLAIFWSIHYKNRVTTDRAGKACFLCLLLSLIVAFGMNVMDKNYTACVSPISVVYTRKTNISLEGIPRLLSVVATVAVSLYAVVVDKRLAKVIPSPVNMQPRGYQEGPAPTV